EPFSNPLVRRAFAHAIDRELVVADPETIALPATRGGAIPPAMPGHGHRIGRGYDVEEARRLLAEAGYPGGKGLPPLRMLLHRNSQPEPFRRLFEAIGAQVEFVAADAAIGP